jgi:hypothetical protein
MAAETLKGQVRTGFIGALFMLAVLFIFGLVTNIGSRFLNAADRGYVDEQDAELRSEIVSGDSALKSDLTELERETERDMDQMMKDLNRRFDDQDKDLDFVVEWIKDK